MGVFGQGLEELASGDIPEEKEPEAPPVEIPTTSLEKVVEETISLYKCSEWNPFTSCWWGELLHVGKGDSKYLLEKENDRWIEEANAIKGLTELQKEELNKLIKKAENQKKADVTSTVHLIPLKNKVLELNPSLKTIKKLEPKAPTEQSVHVAETSPAMLAAPEHLDFLKGAEDWERFFVASLIYDRMKNELLAKDPDRYLENDALKNLKARIDESKKNNKIGFLSVDYLKDEYSFLVNLKGGAPTEFFGDVLGYRYREAYEKDLKSLAECKGNFECIYNKASGAGFGLPPEPVTAPAVTNKVKSSSVDLRAKAVSERKAFMDFLANTKIALDEKQQEEFRKGLFGIEIDLDKHGNLELAEESKQNVITCIKADGAYCKPYCGKCLPVWWNFKTGVEYNNLDQDFSLSIQPTFSSTSIAGIEFSTNAGISAMGFESKTLAEEMEKNSLYVAAEGGFDFFFRPIYYTVLHKIAKNQNCPQGQKLFATGATSQTCSELKEVVMTFKIKTPKQFTAQEADKFVNTGISPSRLAGPGLPDEEGGTVQGAKLGGVSAPEAKTESAQAAADAGKAGTAPAAAEKGSAVTRWFRKILERIGFIEVVSPEDVRPKETLIAQTGISSEEITDEGAVGVPEGTGPTVDETDATGYGGEPLDLAGGDGEEPEGAGKPAPEEELPGEEETAGMGIEEKLEDIAQAIEDGEVTPSKPEVGAPTPVAPVEVVEEPGAEVSAPPGTVAEDIEVVGDGEDVSAGEEELVFDDGEMPAFVPEKKPISPVVPIAGAGLAGLAGVLAYLIHSFRAVSKATD